MSLPKATRLLVEGRVGPDPAGARVFHVEGDHGNYTVVVGAHVAMCSCRASTRCSHIEAAVEWVNADERTLALLERCREQRVSEQRVEAAQVFERMAAPA